MDLFMFAKLKRSLIIHEGLRTHPYTDTRGNITIGIGYNLTSRGIDADWIDNQYAKDINYFYTTLSNEYDWFKHLNEDRQIILIDMCFMGYKRFQGFTKMLAALSDQNFDEAAREMMNSEWAHEVGGRAVSLAYGMKTGVYSV